MDFKKKEWNKLSQQSSENEIFDVKNFKMTLDQSLEQEDISVREELIHRTMKAIENLSVEDGNAQNITVDGVSKKSRPTKTLYRVAGLVAACLVLTCSYLFMQYGSKNYRLNISDNSKAEESVVSDQQKEQYGDNYTGAGAVVTTGKDDADDSGKDDDQNTPKEDVQQDGNELGAVPESAGRAYKIGTIFLAVPQSTDYIKITDLSSKQQTIITNQQEIVQFYHILEGYVYTQNDTMPTQGMLEIEAKSLPPENKIHKMVIGNGILVEGDSSVAKYYSLHSSELEKEIIQKIKSFTQRIQ